MKKQTVLVALLFLAGGLEGRSRPAPSPPAASISVELQFDGGYAYIYDESTGALTVGSFGDTTEHDLRLAIRSGTYVSGPSPDVGKTRWNLDQHDYKISFPDVPRRGLSLPRLGSAPSIPCDADIANGTAEANAMYLFPNITDMGIAAGSDGRVDRTKLKDQVAVEGGALWLYSVTTCFVVLQNGTWVTQRLTAGVAGVRVTFDVPADTLRVNLWDGVGNNVLSIQPDADNRVVLGLGRLDYCIDCAIPTGTKLPMFDRFFDLLSGVDTRKLPELIKVGSDNASPGDECPPGWFVERPRSAMSSGDHH